MSDALRVAQQIEEIWMDEWQEKLGPDVALSEHNQARLHGLRMELESGLERSESNGVTEGSHTPSGIRVKELEWTPASDGRFAEGVDRSRWHCGWYEVALVKETGRWRARSRGPYWCEIIDTLEEAKAACQADCQERVNECLAHTNCDAKATGWRDIESDPPPRGACIVVRIGDWVGTVRINDNPEEAQTAWTAGDDVLHYNGATLVGGFRGPYDGWLPAGAPLPSPPGQEEGE